MATGQTDSREDDSPAKQNVQSMGVLCFLAKLSSQQPGHSKVGACMLPCLGHMVSPQS